MTASPLHEPRQKFRHVDLSFGTVLALSWLAATIATSLTLWLLVGVLGST